MINHERHSIIMSEIMTPDMVNFSGNIHGGHLLKFIDRVGYACAARYARKCVVTLSIDQVIFKQPIHVGEIVTCYANVNYVGRTSMEVGIKIVAENPLTGVTRHTNTCYTTWVAIDEHGKPTPVESLALETDLQKRRFKEAEFRKKLRMEWESKHAEIKKLYL
jgi:acyl-CoA hydrolase